MPAACCGGGGEGDGGCEGGRRDGALWGDRQWEDNTAASVPLRARLRTARGAMVGAACGCAGAMVSEHWPRPFCSGGGMIAVTEPRRVAAVSMARRVAYEMGLSQRWLAA